MSEDAGQRSDRLDALMVALAAVTLHARTIAFGLTGLDDRDLVVDDLPWLSQPSSLWRVFGRSYLGVVDAAHPYYRPLVTWTYAVDARWSGGRAAGFHASNVVLHATACALLWALLRQLALGRGPSLVTAIAFAAHPALTSAVAWIPGRNDSLLAALALASWLAFARRRTGPHLLFFALALLTKETAGVMPAVFLLHAALVEPRGWLDRKRGALHVVAWGALLAGRVLLWPPTPGASLVDVPRLVAGLGRLLLPVHPAAVAATVDVPVWPGLAGVAALAVCVVAVPGVRRRVVMLGAATFALTLVPPLLAGGTVWLDHRLYLPAVGGAVMAAEVVRAAAPATRSLAAYAGVVLAALAAVTLAYQGTFRSEPAFAREAVDDSPRCGLAHVCLGRVLQERGDDDGALVEYRAALALGPSEIAHNNIAVIHMKRAEWAAAEEHLRAELADNPGSAAARRNLAIVLRREGREER